MTLRKYLRLLEDPASGKVSDLQLYLISHGFNRGYDGKPLEATGKFDAHTYFAMIQFMKSNPSNQDKNELKKLAVSLMDAPVTPEDSAIMQKLDNGEAIVGSPNPEKKVDGTALPTSYAQAIKDVGGEGNASNKTPDSSANKPPDSSANKPPDSSANKTTDNVTIDKKLAAQDPGTAKLQEWLSKLGLKGMNGKNLQTDGRFGVNTYYACRKFMASNPNPKLKEEFENLMKQVRHTMWISPATMKKIDDSLPLPKVQAQSDKFMGGQPGYDEAGNKIAESLDRILKLARI
ncbi:MAG: hypothetical protein RLZZ196_486 [Bacteroidota bacterium]|jgi:peptidoglycan hydrolase-like protein with peptidoglycan-binding domain